MGLFSTLGAIPFGYSMKRIIYYRNLQELYRYIQWGGFQGEYSDFLELNIGQVMNYAAIAQGVLSQIDKGEVQ